MFGALSCVVLKCCTDVKSGDYICWCVVLDTLVGVAVMWCMHFVMSLSNVALWGDAASHGGIEYCDVFVGVNSVHL